MQIGAVKSTSFGNNSIIDLPTLDKDKAHRLITSVQTLEDSFRLSQSDVEKKTVMQSIASVAGCAALTASLGAFAYKKGGEILINAKTSTIVQNIENSKLSETISKKAAAIIDRVKGQMATLPKSKQLASFATRAAGTIKGIDKDLTETIGKTPKVGLYTAAIATPVIATRDNNGDGVADMMQRGVNAYESFLQKFGAVKAVADLLA